MTLAVSVLSNHTSAVAGFDGAVSLVVTTLLVTVIFVPLWSETTTSCGNALPVCSTNINDKKYDGRFVILRRTTNLFFEG